MGRTFLITGFDPFGGETVNPAWEAVKALPDKVGDATLVKMQVTTVFGRAGETVLRQAETLHPDVIVCVGQAGGRSKVTPEVVGINLREASIPDNAGQKPRWRKIDSHGADGLFSTLPVREMAEKAQEQGLPCALSYSAGTFVCNDLLYTLLSHYSGTETKVGFVHVPYLPEQAGEGVPSLPIEMIVQTLTVLLSAI